MKRWLIRLGIVVVALAGLMLAAGLIVQSLISGSAKDKLTATLSEKLGAPLTISSADFDLGSWFRLQPAVSLEHVVLMNPPGFPAAPLVEAQRISAELALLPLLHNAIEVKRIELQNPRVRIETNAQGVSNIEALSKHASSSAAPASGAPASSSSSGSGATLSIDELVITGGAIASSNGTLNNRSIEIRLHDFSSDKRCRLEVSAKLFGGSRSSFKLDGHAGPFGSASLPLDGNLTATFALAEMPQSLRDEVFGDLLRAPGDNSTATLSASVSGDAYKTLTAPAKFTFTGVAVGKDAKHTLPLSGDLPVTLVASNLMATPQIEIAAKQATLHLGKGEWRGSVDVRLHGGAMSGSSSGGIHNVDIDELLSAISTASGKVQGTAELSPYSLQFGGKSAAEINRSLKGTAKLSVGQGKLSALDLLASIEKGLGQVQGLTGAAQASAQPADATAGATPFTSLNAGLTVGGEKIDVGDFALEGPTLSATGAGVIGFDHSLSFDLNAKLTGNAATLLNKVAMGSQSNSAAVPVTVSGTVDSPKVRPNVGKVVKSAVTNEIQKRAGGLLDGLLKKK